MSVWKEYKLKDIGCSFLSGFAFKSSDYGNFGIPLIKIGNIQGKTVTINQTGDFISEEILNEKISKYLLKNKDILIAMTGQGSVGRVGRLILKKDEKALLNQRVGKFICDEKGINIEYLFYVLSSEKYQESLFNAGSGSGQPNLSPELILDFEIPTPNYHSQKAIAQVLSSIDDKIDLLHRQNATLEAMAETLFRQWFVEEAKEDWELGRLSDFGSIITGKTPSTQREELWGNSFAFVTPTDYKNFGMFSTKTQRGLSQDGWNTMKSFHLPPNSIMVTCIGSDMGKVSVSSENCITNQQINSIKLYNHKTLGYVYFYLLNQYEVLKNIALGGTTMPIINKTDFSNIEIPIPDNESILKFGIYWDSFSSKINQNQNQIRTLTTLRDTLLPKLMSGEVRIENG